MTTATPSPSSSSRSSSSFKLVGHARDVCVLAGHPFLPMIASGLGDGVVCVWDLEACRCVRTLEGHTNWVLAVAFDPTGRRLVSGSFDNTVKLWDLDSTKSCPVRTLRVRTMGSVRAVAWNLSSTLVASGSDDGRVRVWDAASGTLLHTLEEHFGWVEAVVSHPVGDLFASASDDTTVRVWRWSTGESVHTLEGHTGWVFSLAASAAFVVSGSHDKTVRVWSWRTGLCVRMLDGFGDSLVWKSTLVWQNSRLVASDFEGNLRVWDTADEDPRRWRHVKYLPFKTQPQSGAVMVEGGTRVAFVAGDDLTAIAVWDFEDE